jgi:hypothetical protein
MKPSRPSRGRQPRVFRGLAEGGEASGPPAHVDWDRIGKSEQDVPNSPKTGQPAAPEKIVKEAERRALAGTRVPLVSDGKVVRDDDGRPIATHQYSDDLLHVLLRAHDPERFGSHHYPRWLRILLTTLVATFALWALASVALRLLKL